MQKSNKRMQRTSVPLAPDSKRYVLARSVMVPSLSLRVVLEKSMDIREWPLNDTNSTRGRHLGQYCGEQHSTPVPEKQRRELDKRLESYDLSGDAGVIAVDTIERIRASL
ncbi:MAG: hypothetical protein ACI9DC_000227 [Gammaproteobacteria bacterium]|jgi:hypothetical protein